jgi:metal-dependent amidase/aminoacylase/carboxypeptidase family protein
MLDAIRRIVTAECEASGSPMPPDIELFDRYSLTTNDPNVTSRVSEDFSDIPAALRCPALYLLGNRRLDPAAYREAAVQGRVSQDIPVNHSATFAPVIQPTLDTGTQTLVIAAMAWLAPTR